MDIQTLQAFISVAEHGSFSRAAERLHLTQPAVSKRIAALESEMGARVFDRIGRQVHLTEAGRALLPRARRILLEVEDGRRALSRLSDHTAGPLQVGTSHHIGLHRLPPVLREFVGRFPDVDLYLSFMDSEQACLAVERGDLELAVVTLPLYPKDTLHTLAIWHDPLKVCVAPDHALAGPGTATPRELSLHPSVLPDYGTYTREIIDRAFQAHGVTPRPRLSTNYMETLKMLASIGMGWTALPQTMLDGELVALETPELVMERRLGVVMHTARSLSRAGSELLRLLEAASEH